MKWIQSGVHRSVLHSDGWPQPNNTFWYVLHNPSVCSEQWHSFTCMFWKLPLSSYAFCLAFWWMALANRYVLIRSVQPFRVFWNLALFSMHVFTSTIKFLHVLPCISFKHPLWRLSSHAFWLSFHAFLPANHLITLFFDKFLCVLFNSIANATTSQILLTTPI